MRRAPCLALVSMLAGVVSFAPVAQTPSAATPASNGRSNPTGGQSPPSAPSLTAGAQDSLTREQMVALVREAAEKDRANDKIAQDYAFTERVETRQLDRRGQTKSVESKTYDVTLIDEGAVNRLVARNDRALSPDEAAKEDRRIQKLVKSRESESPQDRQNRLDKQEKDRQQRREFVLEIADAYDFRQLPAEDVEGRPAWVLDGTPRNGFRPRQKEARILSKFHLRVWIDQAERQWVKLDADAVDTVSWGVLLARIHKGSRVEIAQTEVNHEVWLPRLVTVKVDARVALLKTYDVDLNIAFSGYKKFRVSTKTVPAGGSPQP